MIKLVIFDMDGLMFDTERVNYRAYMEVLTEKGLSSNLEEYVGMLGMNAPDIIAHYQKQYGDKVNPEGLFREIGARMAEITRNEGVPVKDGLRELLSVLEEKGVPRAVASGSEQQVIRDDLEMAGLFGKFDVILSAGQVKRGKPHPDVFLEVCRRAGVNPEESLVLEDSVNGVRAAAAGNIPVINVPDLLELPEEDQRKCVAVVKSLKDVIPYIKKEVR